MLGSLYYSLIADYSPCELCWYQRICMYPLAPILLVGAIRKIAAGGVHITEAVAALSPFAVNAASAAYAPAPRAGKARFTPTLNAYSFLEQLNANLADPTKGIDLFGVCDFCVKHDIEAVDLTGYFFPGYPKAPADGYVNRIKRYTHDRGITISGTGVSEDQARGQHSSFTAWEEQLLRFLLDRLKTERASSP